jgi:hypothetical protein
LLVEVVQLTVMPFNSMKGPTVLFPTGDVHATPVALKHLACAGVSALDLLRRHVSGDWGDVSADDRLANDQAVRKGTRLLSAYRIGSERVYLITEWDRSSTTILLASEY